MSQLLNPETHTRSSPVLESEFRLETPLACYRIGSGIPQQIEKNSPKIAKWSRNTIFDKPFFPIFGPFFPIFWVRPFPICFLYFSKFSYFFGGPKPILAVQWGLKFRQSEPLRAGAQVSGSQFDPRPQRLMIFHLILCWRSE